MKKKPARRKIPLWRSRLYGKMTHYDRLHGRVDEQFRRRDLEIAFLRSEIIRLERMIRLSMVPA